MKFLDLWTVIHMQHLLRSSWFYLNCTHLMDALQQCLLSLKPIAYSFLQQGIQLKNGESCPVPPWRRNMCGPLPFKGSLARWMALSEKSSNAMHEVRLCLSVCLHVGRIIQVGGAQYKDLQPPKAITFAISFAIFLQIGFKGDDCENLVLID